MTKNDRWILSEWLVARDRVETLGERLIHHRQETTFGEIDLIFRDAQSGLITVIEVKTLSGRSPWAGTIISRAQTKRLERARWLVELRAKCATRLILATVEGISRAPVIRYFDAPF